MIETLPIGLTTAIESGRCVLFLGAGTGAHARDVKGSITPDGPGLARELAERFDITLAADAEPALSTVAAIVELRKGRAELEAFLAERLSGLEPDETLRWLLGLPWRAIFTTNYDGVIERAFELNSTPARTPVVVSASAEVVSFDPRFELPLYHLHGYLFTAGKPLILITADDYARFYEKRRMLFEFLKYQLVTAPILYLGYSHRDPNWKMVDAELRAEFAPGAPPQSFRVVRETDPLEAELLRAGGIEPIDASITDFAAALQAALGEIRVDAAFLERLAAEVPGDLHDDFEASPAAVARLLRSWTYVNQAPFDEPPNVDEFLLGNLPNWALVGADIPFERDVEEAVFEELLEFATANDPLPRVLLLLGAAGYGISTVLMHLATRLARENAGRVYFHRTGLPVTEGDVVFAAQAAHPIPVFFAVDNAADEAERLREVMQHLRATGVTACFILGERTNEWRQQRVRLSPREFGLLALSDSEADRLLDFLAANGALGELEVLDRLLQLAAVKEKHEKQLLVTMREVTEGRAFDAIIEDEFRSIASDFGRRVYATVCSFYRHRALMRDTVLAEVVDCGHADLYDRIGDELDGVAYFELLDAATGSYVARARHQVIAEIVWERATQPGEREEILLRALQALNLNFHVDYRAFDLLVRSDTTVDGLRTLEAKMRFFEGAAQKDPMSPYVRQHYARMLLREQKPELALAEIDRALALDERNRVLHHTRGVILRHLAWNTQSAEIARRWLLQSEEEFRGNISRDPRDEYSYQSLGELYLGWANRAPTQDEEVDYISRAEEVVNQALRQVRSREGVYIVAAKIQDALGDKPGMIEALRRAVAAAPGGIVARQLLGRELRRIGEPEEAAEILRGVLEGHPEEVAPAIQYALALDDLGRPYAESAAALRLASLYGVRDPRYTATLGGMLFLNADFTEAEKVFSGSETQDFTFAERSNVHFKPRSRAHPGPMLMQGEVVSVRPGFAFIRVPGYPDVFCPGAKFGQLVMERGLEIEFALGFTARGPIAVSPRAVE